MDQRISRQVPVLLGVSLLMLAGGWLTLLSPRWMYGGLVGWWEGADPNTDVLWIGWLSCGFASVMLGMLLLMLGGAVAFALAVAQHLMLRRGPSGGDVQRGWRPGVEEESKSPAVRLVIEQAEESPPVRP